ncbi:MAG: carboxypeptidase M32 [Desulfovibrio sp.]|nr:MAG: carboxypeptidase M32 [Desulfovibrio sp.]
MTERQAYELLQLDSRETSLLASTAALLGWDQSTMIPPAGHGHRAEQLSLLSGLIHERLVNPRREEWLARVEGSGLTKDLHSAEAANIREWRRSFDRAVKLPTRLAVELAKAASLAQAAWEKARPENDWHTFLPHVETLFRLKREEAEAVGYEHEPYDALLDVYEPGETAASLAPLFSALGRSLAALLEQIIAANQSDLDRGKLMQGHDSQAQEALVREIVRDLGFDFSSGRLDISAHPFSTTIGPGDARITVRYQKADLVDGLFGAIHETGHALYEMGLPTEHWGSPAGESVSLGVHESQSRLWENFVGRSQGFVRYLLPLVKTHLPGTDSATHRELYRAVNVVSPSLIRTEADEVTYNLHVILRFELETALLRGDLAVKDLPGAWDEKMQHYLGITPPDPARGCMQDVHWAAGLIGYFPTYTLGNLYAAHLFAAAQRDLGDLDQALSQGEFLPLLEWLRTNIHAHGMRFSPRELIRRASGEDLNPERLLTYLEAKFAQVYDL